MKDTFNHNPYNLPEDSKKRKKKKQIPQDDIPIGRKQFLNFKITVEEKEIEILESILKAYTDSESDMHIKSIVKQIIERYKQNEGKPLILTKEVSDLLHRIFIPTWQ